MEACTTLGFQQKGLGLTELHVRGARRLIWQKRLRLVLREMRHHITHGYFGYLAAALLF